jgi:hypothetical protein
MTYNKALEDKWGDVRAVRHEVMLRRQAARDCYPVLLDMLRLEDGPECRHLAEVRFTQSVLAKQMTYLDTTRLARITDKRQWPENWAKDSEPASFWREVVDGVPEELRVAWRAEKALEDSHRAMKAQYGRKDAQWFLWRKYACGQSREEAMEESFAESMSRLQAKDVEEILPLIPEARRAEALADFREWQAAAAHNVEGGASRDPLGGKTDPAL